MLRATHDNLACHLLKLEQQLRAYEKLHAGEVAEMWHTLNECKQAIADIASASEPVNPAASDAADANACSPDDPTPDSRG